MSAILDSDDDNQESLTLWNRRSGKSKCPPWKREK